ncbi:MAG: alpha/beta fold hydrolase [Janthinobacterium lividum]
MTTTTNVSSSDQENDLKETLVFLHYFGGSAQSWQWVIAHLQKDYNCIALNLPGFAGEPALPEPSIAAYASFIRKKLESMNVESYVLIGHSMSGKLAVDVTANDPNFAVKQLILVAPSPPTAEQISDEELQKRLNHPDQKQAEIAVEKSTILPLSEAQRALIIKNNLESDNKTWRWWLISGRNHSIIEDSSRLFLPITVLASEDDPSISFESILNETIPHLPDAKLVTTKGVGHLIPIEAPEWLAEQIKLAIIQE